MSYPFQIHRKKLLVYYSKSGMIQFLRKYTIFLNTAFLNQMFGFTALSFIADLSCLQHVLDTGERQIRSQVKLPVELS